VLLSCLHMSALQRAKLSVLVIWASRLILNGNSGNPLFNNPFI
jgi:hypothetical protein